MSHQIVVFAPPLDTAAPPPWWRVLELLAARGHRVTAFVPADAAAACPAGAVSLVPYPNRGQAGALRALVCARGADLIVKTSHLGALDAYLDRAVPELRRAGTALAYWALGPDAAAPQAFERRLGAEWAESGPAAAADALEQALPAGRAPAHTA